MKTMEDIILTNKLQNYTISNDYGEGYICIPPERKLFYVIFTTYGGWDHVSVSLSYRCPTWDEMCVIKNTFFNDEECVIQYHPPKSMYVNFHEYCLHLWKPQEIDILIPDKESNTCI